jgi:hypothetical protein
MYTCISIHAFVCVELGLREADVANEKAIKEKKKRTSDTLLKILKFYEKNDRHQYVEAKKLYEDSENKRRKLREEVFKPYVSVGQRVSNTCITVSFVYSHYIYIN